MVAVSDRMRSLLAPLRLPSRARPNDRRALRVFAWTAGVFLACQLACSTLFDYAFPSFRFPFFYRQSERVEKLKNTSLVVCLGSSRFGVGLEHKELTALLRSATGDSTAVAINAAVPAGDFITSQRLFETILESGVLPKLLVLEVCPDALNHRGGFLGFHAVRTLRWDDAPAFAIDLAAAGYLDRFAVGRIAPMYQLRGAIRERLNFAAWEIVGHRDPNADPNAPVDPGKILKEVDGEWGLMPGVDLHDDDPARKARLLEDLKKHFRDYRLGGNPERAFVRILEQARQKAIPVVLVGVPVASDHRAFYTPEIDALYRDRISRARSEYGCGFVELRDFVPDTEFRDHHHCLPAGARRLTRALANDVLAPRWGGVAPASLPKETP